jgi:peptide deformylase
MVADSPEIMTIRPIVRYPNPHLAIPARPVTEFDGALRELASDLLDTMHAAPGIGITAPHIGVSLRVVVLDLGANEGAHTYVNPEIAWASSEMILHREGSISMPGVNDEVQRHARVRISYQDVDGNMQTEESDGLRACVVFIWAAAAREIQTKMMAKGSTAVTAAVQKHDPKARTINKIDDFAYVKEAVQLLAAMGLGLLDKSEKDTLEESLDLRNRCGHPSKYTPGVKKVSAFVEDVTSILFS